MQSRLSRSSFMLPLILHLYSIYFFIWYAGCTAVFLRSIGTVKKKLHNLCSCRILCSSAHSFFPLHFNLDHDNIMCTLYYLFLLRYCLNGISLEASTHLICLYICNFVLLWFGKNIVALTKSTVLPGIYTGREIAVLNRQSSTTYKMICKVLSAGMSPGLIRC